MFLKYYIIERLHGHIDVNLDLFEDLSIILGGNGEGKTSALNFLCHILRFNTSEIISTKFDRAQIVFGDVEKSNELRLDVSRDGDVITFALTENDAVIEASLSKRDTMRDYNVSDWLRDDARLKGGFIVSGKGELIENNTFQQYAKSLSKIERTITTAAHLTFVRLDRTITALDSSGVLSREAFSDELKNHGKRVVKDPLSVVEGVVSAKYLEYRNKSEELNLAAQQSSFDLHFEIGTEKSATLEELRKLESSLNRLKSAWAVSAFASDARQGTFDDFIQRLSSLATNARKILQEKKKGRRSAAEEAKLIVASEYSRKVQSLVSLLEGQNEKVASALAQLSRYIDVVNMFFKDSGKRLFLSSLDNCLYYRRASSEEKVLYMDASKGESLSGLSSGERQVLILLTYLAFSMDSSKSSIFLVDEPELSLHLHWQAKLIPAMRKLTPNGCQVIMATHAPEIAGRARDKCMPVNYEKLKSNMQGS